MSAKKVEKAEKPETVKVRLDLSVEQHRQLRVTAAHAGVSMAEFARAAVLRAVEAAADPTKKKNV